MFFKILDSAALGFMAIMGLLFFLPPWIVILFKLSFRLGCKKALGKVTRIEKNYDAELGMTLLQSVIEFENQDGERVEYKAGIGYGLRYMPRLHSTVKLYYRPHSQPLKAQIASRGLWEVSAALMLTGLILMLPLLLSFFLNKR